MTPEKSYDLQALRELNIPSYAEKIYLETSPAGISWKDETGRYVGCCPSLAKMYDSSIDQMLGKDELEQKDIILESARALFTQEDQHIFKNNKKYIAFGSFQYADSARHVCYTKEKFFDEKQNKSFVLVTGIEVPKYIMSFLISSQNQSAMYQHSPQELQITNTLHFSNANLTAEKYGITLSDREEECLFLILRGHTAKSVAQVLNLSVRTIEFHSDKLKEKLDSSRKNQLIKTAIELGYLNLIPQRFLMNSGFQSP